MTVFGRNTETLLTGLSDFWQRFFEDAPLLEAIYAGAEVQLGQAYLELLTNVLNMNLRQVPLFNKEYWKLLTIRQDLVRLDPDDSRWKFELPDSIVDFQFLLNRVYSPTVALERDVDFQIDSDERVLSFDFDPFSPVLDGVPTRQVTIDPTTHGTGAGGFFVASSPLEFNVTGLVRKGIDGEAISTVQFQSDAAAFTAEDIGRQLVFSEPGGSPITRLIDTVLDGSAVVLDSAFVIPSPSTGLRWEVREVSVFNDGDVGTDVVVSNPFVLGDLQTREIVSVDPGGKLVTLDAPLTLGADAEGVLWTHQSKQRVTELAFWVPDAFIDNENLYLSFGYLVDQYLPSSESYRALLEGVYRYYVLGPSLGRTESALNVMSGIPVAREEGEVVEVVDTSNDDYDLVTTDRRSYEMPKGGVRDNIVVGYELQAFESLSSVFTVEDATSDPTWYWGSTIPTTLMPDEDAARRNIDPKTYPLVFGDDRWRIGDPGLFIGADSDGLVVPKREGRNGLTATGLDTTLFAAYGEKFFESDVGKLLTIEGVQYEILSVDGTQPGVLAHAELDTDIAAVFTASNYAASEEVGLSRIQATGALLTQYDVGRLVRINAGTLAGNDYFIDRVLSPEIFTVVDENDVAPTFASGDVTSVFLGLVWELERRAPLKHGTGYTVMRNMMSKHVFQVAYNLADFPDVAFARTDGELREVLLEGKSAYVTLFFDPGGELEDLVTVTDSLSLIIRETVIVELGAAAIEVEGQQVEPGAGFAAELGAAAIEVNANYPVEPNFDVEITMGPASIEVDGQQVEPEAGFEEEIGAAAIEVDGQQVEPEAGFEEEIGAGSIEFTTYPVATETEVGPLGFVSNTSTVFGIQEVDKTLEPGAVANASTVNAITVAKEVALGASVANESIVGGPARAWLPTDLADLFAWWDPSDSDTITLDGSDIEQIDDKSGNARHLTRVGTGATQGTENSLDTVQSANSATNYLIYAASVSTVVESYSMTIDSLSDTTFIHGAGDSTTELFGAAQATGLSPDNAAGTPSYFVDGEPLSPTTRQELLNQLTGGAHVFGAVDLDLSNWTDYRPYFYAGGGGFQYTGEWGDVVLVTAALSTYDRQRLEGYLAHKWGTEAELDADHPFKSAPPMTDTAVTVAKELQPASVSNVSTIFAPTVEVETLPSFLDHAWEADALVTVGTTNVTNWEDRVSGDDLAPSGNDPEFVANHRGALPAIHVDGNNNEDLLCTFGTPWTASGPGEVVTIVVVYEGENAGMDDDAAGRETVIWRLRGQEPTYSINENIFGGFAMNIGSSGQQQHFIRNHNGITDYDTYSPERLGVSERQVGFVTWRLHEFDEIDMWANGGKELEDGGVSYAYYANDWEEVEWQSLFISPDLDDNGDVWIRAIYVARETLTDAQVEELHTYIENKWFDIQDDATNLENWWDVSDATTIWTDTSGTTAATADDDQIQRIDDKGNQGADLTFNTTAPTLQTQKFQGHPCAFFAGGDDEWRNASADNNSEDVTIVFVGRFYGGSTDRSDVLASGSGGSERIPLLMNTNPEHISDEGPGFYDGTDWDAFAAAADEDEFDRPFVIAPRYTDERFPSGFNRPYWDAYLDGHFYADSFSVYDASWNNTSALLRVGGSGDAHYDFAELRVYDRLLSPIELKMLSLHLEKKWSAHSPAFASVVAHNWSAKQASEETDATVIGTLFDRFGEGGGEDLTGNSTATKETVSGLPVLEFPGTDEFFNTTISKNSSYVYFFVVCRFDDISADHAIIDGWSLTGEARLYMDDGTGLAFNGGGSDVQTNEDVTGAFHLIEVHWDTSTPSCEIFIDGVSEATGNPGSENGVAGLRIGSSPVGAIDSFEGEWAELAMYRGQQLTEIELTRIRAWFASEWGTILP